MRVVSMTILRGPFCCSEFHDGRTCCQMTSMLIDNLKFHSHDVFHLQNSYTQDLWRQRQSNIEWWWAVAGNVRLKPILAVYTMKLTLQTIQAMYCEGNMISSKWNVWYINESQNQQRNDTQSEDKCWHFDKLVFLLVHWFSLPIQLCMLCNVWL